MFPSASDAVTFRVLVCASVMVDCVAVGPEVITGGVFVTVTLAVPLTPPLAAVTVYGPPAVLPAVKSPLPLIVPPPLTVQVKTGCDSRALPN